MQMIAAGVRAFLREEDGIALSEYLVLLGLLIGGVIAAVTFAAGSLSTAWRSWGNFFSNSLSCTTSAGSGISC